MKKSIWFALDFDWSFGFLISYYPAEYSSIHIHIMCFEFQVYWGVLEN